VVKLSRFRTILVTKERHVPSVALAIVVQSGGCPQFFQIFGEFEEEEAGQDIMRSKRAELTAAVAPDHITQEYIPNPQG